MALNIRDFLDTVQMEFAIADIRRYQRAYKDYNGKGIMVRHKKGWFAIGQGAYQRFIRPTNFRNMIDVLEKKVQ